MFIGYHTIYGPNGYIEASTKEEVEMETKELLVKYPNALSGEPRRNWLTRPLLWRVTIWSRIELSGN